MKGDSSAQSAYEGAQEARREALLGGGKKQAKPLPFIDMSSWDAAPAPPRPWLVLDHIPRRQPTLLSGHGEAGKSTLLLQLLCATVLGRDWIGLLPEFGPAIYLGAEEEEDELHRRLDPILKFYEASYSDLLANGFKLLSYAGKDMVLGIINKQGRVQATDLLRQLYRDACTLKPKLIAIDGLSDIYVGNERERSQVRQFMGLFRRLAIDTDGAVVIAAHPSLAGMTSGSGISGSTQWFNSVRGQMYLKTASEDEEDDDKNAVDDNGLRELQFLKNQYGRKGPSIRLQWKDGLFLPVQSPETLDKLAAERKAENIFLTLLQRFNKQERNVSDKAGPSYAPVQFAKEPEAKKAKVTANALADAMRRLFAAEKIRILTEGPPSRRRSRIIEWFQPDPSNAPSNALPTPSNDLSTHTPYIPPPSVGTPKRSLESPGRSTPGEAAGTLTCAYCGRSNGELHECRREPNPDCPVVYLHETCMEAWVAAQEAQEAEAEPGADAGARA
jgi:RecA-family ATPase